MTEHLLPQNATDLEQAFSLASNPAVRLDLPVTIIRGIKLIGTPPPWLPFLVYEYGLGELSPYVPNLYQLIDEGIDWQRVRGTPNAIEKGLAWINYAGEIEEAPIRRARWHLFQLEMDRVRDEEEPDLFRIEGITQLSVPVRSHFWRGFRTYDVRATEYGWKAWSGSLWSSYSGARIRTGGAKWSFGRLYELDHTMTEAELTALGVWIAEVTSERPYTWEHVAWPQFPWGEIDEAERRQLIIQALAAMSAWVTFVDAEDTVIGHRRARVWKPTKAGSASAPYRIGSAMRTLADSDATGLYIEAMTDFGDGYPATAVKWQVRLGATLVDPTRPGLLWAEPGELTGGTVAVEKTDTIEFGRTVRERCRALLRVV
jgi:P2-related tail formation protein